MLRINGKEVTAIYIAGQAVQAVYSGAKLVWQAVRSCFGSGIWVGSKPWIGSEKWKGHK